MVVLCTVFTMVRLASDCLGWPRIASVCLGMPLFCLCFASVCLCSPLIPSDCLGLPLQGGFTKPMLELCGIPMGAAATKAPKSLTREPKNWLKRAIVRAERNMLRPVLINSSGNSAPPTPHLAATPPTANAVVPASAPAAAPAAAPPAASSASAAPAAADADV